MLYNNYNLISAICLHTQFVSNFIFNWVRTNLFALLYCSCFYTVKWFQLLLSNIYNSILFIHLHTIKWFQVLLRITNDSTKHQSFVDTQLDGQTVLFLTIRFNGSDLSAHSLNVKQFYLTYVLPLRVRVDLGAMAMKV